MQPLKEYQKHKDRKPEDTVNQLQNILHNAGIDVTYHWQNNDELECYSNRVQITGTGMGSNGKGTSRAYALASGYAELMERLQNGVSYTGALNPEFIRQTGMVAAPDERFETASELAAADNAVMEIFFNINSCKNNFEKLICLQKWSGKHPIDEKGEDTLLTVPFVSLKKRELVHLPFTIYTRMYGTNGMCAGNTMEEALVQGIAEVFERYVSAYLIYNPVTPPTVPDDYLMQYVTLWERIRKIEKDGQYKVIVKDCSLGKGYPVVSTIIINQEKGTFGFRIASHCSFPIALERTLTEALQGRNLEEFTRINRIEPEDACIYKENLANIFKCGVGSFRKELLYEKPSYPFFSWENKGQTNSDMLNHMKNLLLREGHEILVRDVSFMGFPSYQIIVPGISEQYPVDDQKLRETNTLKKISENIVNLQSASDEDVERILRVLLYKKDALFEATLANIFKRPFNNKAPGGQYQSELLLAACYYRLGRIEEAGTVMSLFETKATAQNEKDSLYYRGVGLLLQLKYEKTPDDEICEILEKITGSEIAEKVVSVWMEPQQIFEKLYPRFNCWNCSDCEAGFMCDYGKTEEVLKKLRQRYQNNIPDQKTLLETL